jgi:hypothetical protein
MSGEATQAAASANTDNATAASAAQTQEQTTAPVAGVLTPEEGSKEPKEAVAGEGILNPAAQEDGKKEDQGEKKAEVPEKYEFKLPEGFVADETATTEASGLFRELGLSQDQAQKLVDSYVGMLQKQQSATQAALIEQRKTWQEELKKSPTFAEDVVYARKGLSKLAQTPEEKALFQNTWMSDNPHIFRMFARAGRLLGEDNVGSGNPENGVTDVNQLRFPVNK